VDSWTCVLICVGAIDNLVAILAAHPLDDCIKTDVPLSSESLCILNAPPDAGNFLVLDMLSSARRTVGIFSFISSMRPDVQLAFKILSRCVNERRLTVYAWREIRRMAAYLTGTRHLGLTLRRSNGQLTAYVDSPLANGPEGRSWGGYALRFETTGLASGCFDVKCSLPNSVTEASAPMNCTRRRATPWLAMLKRSKPSTSTSAPPSSTSATSSPNPSPASSTVVTVPRSSAC
jgi:hypothetical protein